MYKDELLGVEFSAANWTKRAKKCNRSLNLHGTIEVHIKPKIIDKPVDPIRSAEMTRRLLGRKRGPYKKR